MESVYFSPAGVNRSHAFGRLATLVETALFVSIALAALFGLVRRLDGGIDAPLSALALAACGIVLAIVVSMPSLGSRYLGRRPTSLPRQGAVQSLPVVAVLLAAMALSIPGSSAWGLLGLWGLVLSGMVVAHRGLGVRRIGVGHRSPARQAADEEFNRDVNQRWTRRREPDGAEVIEGWIRAELAPRTRVAHVHAMFCPPFASTPQVEAEPVDGPPAALRIGPVYPHGARVEIRLEQPAVEKTSVAIALQARGAPASGTC